MRKLALILGLGLLAIPANAQIQPLTPQELTQQNDATIQKSGDALNRAMVQQQIGQIEQQQRQQQLLSTSTPPPAYAAPAYPDNPVPAYLDPPPPKSAAPKKPPTAP